MRSERAENPKDEATRINAFFVSPAQRSVGRCAADPEPMIASWFATKGQRRDGFALRRWRGTRGYLLRLT
jgi:hypothetical protein